MQQFFIAIILVLGLGSYYLYNQNETLKANNQKLNMQLRNRPNTGDSKRVIREGKVNP